MTHTVKQTISRFRYTLIGTVLALAVGTAGVITFAQPNSTTPSAAAASCDKVNIVHCGLGGSSASGHISSFKGYYNRGSDGRYNDLKAVYRWAGATNAKVSGMNTGNTKVGTLYRNGDIKVDGKVVGRDSWFAARFGAGRQGFVHVTSNVYARKTTTSLAHDTYRVIVHFNQNGQADFAVAVSCGNAIRFTPTPPPPPPKPVLKCERLTFSVVNRDNRTYEFRARASAKNTRITSYVFRFGDGNSKTVRTNNTTATTRHKFAKADTRYVIKVFVNSTRKSGVTSANCKVSLRTAPERALVCVSLTARVSGDNANRYTFTARAKPTATTIRSYVFNFGDGESQTIRTSNTTAQTTHTYEEAGAEFTARVAVNSNHFSNVSGPKCTVTVTTPEQPESPVLVCESLNFNSVVDPENTYKFTATASASNTTITSYVFNFGDGNSETVDTSETTAMATHTYSGNEERTATVTVNSEDIQNVTSPNCKVTIPKTPIEECKPGVPIGSPECEEAPPEECLPGVPVGSVECNPPQVLSDTGPGSAASVVGFFATTSLAGAFIHRVILRRNVA